MLAFWTSRQASAGIDEASLEAIRCGGDVMISIGNDSQFRKFAAA
ncbi:hypothetical protein B0G69_6671 [Paraburkholderia sp. RAU2J]|nr:hypothetical protein [Paraburkholderia sp. RAU2J]RKT13507.1 hypothetical protein B0G69_6671 [Paraburkholderia sp. RAU2J]